MTYALGSSILAADYNNFTGGVLVTSPFLSSAAALNKVAAIYGVGFGDIGYGQSAIQLPIKSQSQLITAADWIALRSVILECAQHQGTSLPQLPSSSFFTAANSINVANDVTNNLVNSIISITNNRLNFDISQMSLITNTAAMTRTASWSSNISGSFRISFSTEDSCRFFFNSGGQIRIRAAHANTSSQQNDLWNSLLTDMGSIVLGSHGTTTTGVLSASAGYSSNISYSSTYQYNATNIVAPSYANGSTGYYQLSTTDFPIFNGDNIASAANHPAASLYAANDIYVYAKASGTPTNGSRGKTIDITITLADQHANAFSDTVAAGTTAYIDILKAIGNLSGIETPSVTVLSNW